MIYVRISLVAMVGILACGAAAAAQTTVTLFFDPADFFDFRPLGPGSTDNFSTEGGMFKLHEVWPVPGPPGETLRSWQGSDRDRLDEWVDSLGPNGAAGSEGIGFFNIDFTSTGTAAWGQTISVLSIDAAFAPEGWVRQISGNRVAWTANNSPFYVRPDTPTYNDGRSFGVRIVTNDDIPLGAEETLWFGGFNLSNVTAFTPAVTFDDNWGAPPTPGFASVIADPGSGFEATLSLVRDFIEADFNDNLVVDGDDFLAWQSGFGIPSQATRADGDADFDGDVDGDDFLIWQSQFGLSVPGAGNGSGSVAAAPEPTTSMLLVVTAFLLVSVRRTE